MLECDSLQNIVQDFLIVIQYDGSLQPLIWTRWDVSKTRCCSQSSVYRPHDPEVPSLEQLLINNIITDWNTVQNDAVNAIGQWFSSRTTWPGGGSTWIGSNLRGVMSRPAWCNLKWGSRGVQLFFVTFSSVKKKKFTVCLCDSQAATGGTVRDGETQNSLCKADV